MVRNQSGFRLIKQQYYYPDSTNGDKYIYSHSYIWPKAVELIASHCPPPGTALELGCGNGSASGFMRDMGYSVTAIDESESGIRVAMETVPGVRFEVASVYDNLLDRYGSFPLVVSFEVIEHLVSPLQFLSTIWNVLQPGGWGIISTPFHGYWKNLVLAITGKLDAHFTANWEGGHIKFFSVFTISELLRRKGFVNLEFQMAGRFPPFWKSMIVAFQKPVES
jgi:2-polyprenyl-6-hydroxyphenyl methylase/3-demethylubiquinone-9 3-methyltransferase